MLVGFLIAMSSDIEYAFLYLSTVCLPDRSVLALKQFTRVIFSCWEEDAIVSNVGDCG
jgi:hypothetical protein